MDVTYRCIETDAEEPYTVRESLRNIKCNINDKTAHLHRSWFTRNGAPPLDGDSCLAIGRP